MSDRTEIAARIAAGMMANDLTTRTLSPEGIAIEAVKQADALLAELSKPHAPGAVPLAELNEAAQLLYADAARALAFAPLHVPSQGVMHQAEKLLALVERMKEAK